MFTLATQAPVILWLDFASGLCTTAIERAFAHPGPALLDITTDPNALSAEEARGFALALKTVCAQHCGTSTTPFDERPSAP